MPFPDTVEDLNEPVHDDPLALSVGKTQIQYVKDLNDRVDVFQQMLVGPAFRNPKAYTAVAATQLANAEVLAADAPMNSAWAGGSFTAAAPSPTHTEGSNSIKATLKFNQTTDALRVTFGTNQTIGSYQYVAFDLRWSYPSASSFDPNLFCVARITDGTSITTGTFSDVELGTLPEDTWITVLVPTTGLTVARSVGIVKVRTTVAGQPVCDATSPSSFRIDYWIDNVRFVAVTEFDAAIATGAGTVLVPASYTPAVPQTPKEIPGTSTIIDLRPGNTYVSRIGGVRHVREFGVPEDGTTECSGVLSQMFHSLDPGTELHFPPDKQYNCGAGLTLQNLTDVTIDFHGSTLYSTPTQSWLDGTITKSAPTWSQMALIGYNNVTLRNLNLVGYRTNFYTGNILVNHAGSPSISGTTKLLAAQNDEVKATSSNDRRYSRDKDGLIKFTATLSDSAQVASDCRLAFTDVDTGTVIASSTLTLTGTPTLYTLSFTPGIDDLARNYRVSVKKMTATANTITVTSLTDYGQISYWSPGSGPGGSDMEFYAGIEVRSGDRLTVENTRIEGFPGDGSSCSDSSCWNVTFRKIISRGNSRQGMSHTSGNYYVLEDSVIRESARSGFDFEPIAKINNRVDYARMSRVLILNSGNTGIASGPWDSNYNITIEDITVINAGTGAYGGGMRGGVIRNFFALDTGEFNFNGQNVVLENINTNGDFLVPDIVKSAQQPDLSFLSFYPGGNTIVGLRALGRVQIKGSNMLVGGVGHFSNTMDTPYGDLASSQVGSFDIGRGANLLSTNAEASGIDPGRYRFSFPKTYKGIAHTKPWFPAGLNMLQDPIVNLRGIGGTTTKGNNLSGVGVAVTAGATSQAVAFPTRVIGAMGNTTQYNGSNTGGTISSGTWFCRTGARDLYGGPQSWNSEQSVVIGGANAGVINVSARGFAPVGGGFQIPGFTYMRGTVSGTYTQRYDFLPSRQFYGLRQDTNTFIDNGATLVPNATAITDMWGYPTTGVAVQTGSWTAVNMTGWEADTNYAVFIETSWQSTWTVTKTTAGFTVNFGVACPVGGGTFNWLVVR